MKQIQSYENNGLEVSILTDTDGSGEIFKVVVEKSIMKTLRKQLNPESKNKIRSQIRVFKTLKEALKDYEQIVDIIDGNSPKTLELIYASHGLSYYIRSNPDA